MKNLYWRVEKVISFWIIKCLTLTANWRRNQFHQFNINDEFKMFHLAGSTGDGFHIGKDPTTGLYTLRVASNGKEWKIYIARRQIPRSWVHISFTWEKYQGLKLYFNAREVFTFEIPYTLGRTSEKLSADSKKIIIGSKKPNNFEISHLSVWEGVLDARTLDIVYSKHVLITNPDQVKCCSSK